MDRGPEPGSNEGGKQELGCGNREERGQEPGWYEAGTCRYRAGHLLKNMKQKVVKIGRSQPFERMEDLEEEVNMVSIDPETSKGRKITTPRRFQHFYYF